MNKTLTKALNRPIKRKAVLKIHIYIQMLLHFLALKALNNHVYNIVEYLSIILALIYSFVVYIAILLNNKNKPMVYYYSVSTVVLSFFLIMDLIYLKYTNIAYSYVQVAVLFIVLDITLKVLTQNINRGLFYKYIIVALWTIIVVFGILKIEIYMLVYQVTFLIISIYPIIYMALNLKTIKNYGRHLIPKLLSFVAANTIFVTWIFFISQSHSGAYNYDFYIYLNLVEIFLSYLVLSALGLWELVKSKKNKINKHMVVYFVFIILYLYCVKDNKENLKIIIFSLFSFFMISKQFQLLNYYIKLENDRIDGKPKDLIHSSLFKDIVETSILDFRKEEIYKERVADFLHDEILQDAIYIKRELRDKYKISTNDKIFSIVDKMINTTRGQISLYKPYINYNTSLAENYYNLIQSLKKRFSNDNILIDFICDDKLFLSSPYDFVIYRIIHELVTNIFKHSKGDFSVIELKIENKKILLTVTNHGDYLVNDTMKNMDSRGLKIIKREVDRFGGTLDIISSIEPDVLGNKNIFDNSTVNISIKIPIKGEITYGHFINR